MEERIPQPSMWHPSEQQCLHQEGKERSQHCGGVAEWCLFKLPPKGYLSWAELQSPVTLQGRRFLFCVTTAWEVAGCDHSFSVPSLLRGTRGNLEQQMLEKPDHFNFCRAEAKTCSLDEKVNLSRGCALITHGRSTSLCFHA